MNRRQLLCFLAIPALIATLGAQTSHTKDAEGLVKEAIAYCDAHGQNAALREFTVATSKFRRFGGELYIMVYDLEGKCLAHGQEPNKVGISALQSKDPDGKEFIKERIARAKASNHGWQDYTYKNPKTGLRQPKTTYFELHNGLLFSAGIYKL
jgi:signal transduction histidine kinase